MGTSHKRLKSRRRIPGTLLGILLLMGCTAEPSSLAAQPSPASHQVGEQVFAVGYGRIAEIYLDPVDMGRLTSDGLRGLTNSWLRLELCL